MTATSMAAPSIQLASASVSSTDPKTGTQIENNAQIANCKKKYQLNASLHMFKTSSVTEELTIAKALVHTNLENIN